MLNVRAIADGEIVHARRPTPRNANPSPAEPRNYNPYGDPPAWTDDGCVIIRHATEIGADAQNQPVQVSFMSIYMHLSELRGRPTRWQAARRIGPFTARTKSVWPEWLRHRSSIASRDHL